MKRGSVLAAATVLAGLGMAAIADAQSREGWGVGHGSWGQLGLAEGPIIVDVVGETEIFLDVSVNGCGGERDVRAFGTRIDGGDRQAADAAAALTRLLGEARRVCGFELGLASRIAEGFEPTFVEWAVSRQNTMSDMNMSDMNMVVCGPEDCNAI